MNFVRHLHWLLLGLVLLATVPAYGQRATAVGDSVPVEVLILPIVNYSEVGQAHTDLLPRLHGNLTRLGITYLTSEQLRPTLRKHRIRSRGWIGREAVEILHRETEARYLVVGSWDIFRTGNNPEVGFSLRVLDLEKMLVVRAVSLGLTGEDFTGALGLGRIDDIGLLADVAMERACDDLFPVIEVVDPGTDHRGCRHVALIPFDNFSGVPNAGDIMTHIVLSGLLAQGYFVVEPGFVRELGLTLEIINRGGVDRGSARSIRSNLEGCWVLTGAVEKFSTARGDPNLTAPELAVGIRVMSPDSGNLLLMEDLHGAGDDDESLFQTGRINALMPLANKVLRKFLEEVNKQN